MLSDQALMDSIFETALRGCNVDVAARRDALWDATVCLQADVLRSLESLWPREAAEDGHFLDLGETSRNAEARKDQET